MKSPKHTYDAFISHAVEDKIPIANELTERLERLGLKIWYSGKELRVGSSVTDTILEGLKRSRFGIVILSKNYISKHWPLREFYLLVDRQRNNEGKKVILPVLHQITAEELVKLDSSMVDLYAIDASRGLDHVVTKLLEEIHVQKKEDEKKSFRAKFNLRIGLSLSIGLIVLLGCLWYSFIPRSLTQADIDKAIQERILNFSQKIIHEHEMNMQEKNGRAALVQEISNVYSNFRNLKSYYRNAYEFDNDYITANSKKRVSDLISIDVESLSPFNSYGFSNPNMYVFGYDASGKQSDIEYTFINTQPVSYSIENQYSENGKYLVTINYENNLRMIHVVLHFPENTSDTKLYNAEIKGFLSVETYLFEKQGNSWIYSIPVDQGN